MSAINATLNFVIILILLLLTILVYYTGAPEAWHFNAFVLITTQLSFLVFKPS